MKEIVLPLSPDYTGYGGISLAPEAVKAYRPSLDVDQANHRFKYRPDFDQLEVTDQTGLVLFSRPCNPTGNVLTGEEVQQIAGLAAVHGVPVFVDSAYAPPFPALNFTEMEPIFGDNIVHCMSLSKAGLPGERLGIAIGDAEIIHALECFQTNLCIHSSRYGQAIAARAIASGETGENLRNGDSLLLPGQVSGARSCPGCRHAPGCAVVPAPGPGSHLRLDLGLTSCPAPIGNCTSS